MPSAFREPEQAADCVALFATLARYGETHEFNLTQVAASARDELAETETPVARQPIGFIVRVAQLSTAVRHLQ